MAELNRSAQRAIKKCFDDCQGLARYSVEESDRYWELAEELMALEAKRTR